MAIPADETGRVEERFLERVSRLRATPDERTRLAATGRPFDYQSWQSEAGPPLPEELAEMEELLRERAAERGRSLAAEGVHRNSDR